MTQTHEDTRRESVEVIWHGHSCFEIRCGSDSAVIDPFLEVPGYGQLDLSADLVLVSHEHDDHNARERVALTGRKSAIQVQVIESFHDKEEGRLRGPNRIHLVSLCGLRLAHLGDLGHPLEQADLDLLRDLDVLLIPVGGHYTIDSQEAAAIVKALAPRLTVPMHYREAAAGWQVTSGVEPFLRYFDRVRFSDRSSFLPEEEEGGVLVLRNPMI